MAPHSSTLAWKIPWTEKTPRLSELCSVSFLIFACNVGPRGFSAAQCRRWKHNPSRFLSRTVQLQRRLASQSRRVAEPAQGGDIRQVWVRILLLPLPLGGPSAKGLDLLPWYPVRGPE